MTILFLVHLFTLALSQKVTDMMPGSGQITLQVDECLSWRLPTPGLLSFEFSVTNSSGWGHPLENQAYFDTMLVSEINWLIYKIRNDSIKLDTDFFFGKKSWIQRRDLYLSTEFGFDGYYFLIFDNTFLWDFDSSARPPAGSSLTIQYTVEYALSDTTLSPPCGIVTLNKNPNPPFYKMLPPDVYNIQFGIDSCASDIVSLPNVNITASPCSVLAYVLEEPGFLALQMRNPVNVTFDVALQPPANGELFQLNATKTLYFVVFAKKATAANTYFRVDKLGQYCGQTAASGNCTLGTVGCACAGGACVRDAACNSTTNICESCPIGALNCACSRAGACQTLDLRCVGASLRSSGVCRSCVSGSEGCLPEPVAPDKSKWSQCRENLLPLNYGRVPSCVACPRGSRRCRCLVGGFCNSNSTLDGPLKCDASSDECVALTNITTSTTTASTTATTSRGMAVTTTFVVEPLATRGTRAVVNSASILNVAEMLVLASFASTLFQFVR